MDLVLHGYWRSSPSWRVRIALAWKGLPYRHAPVNLLAGEHRAPAHLRLNPQGRIPVLEVDGAVMVQGPAILEWLEEAAPSPPLLPSEPLSRQRVRAMAAVVACDIAPLQNLGAGEQLERLGVDAAGVASWRAHFIAGGLRTLEGMAAEHGGAFLHGDALSLADLHLVPQLYGARRFGVDLAPYPRLLAAEARCAALPAFQAAAPERQPDAPAPS